jgi:hypothetical protein
MQIYECFLMRHKKFVKITVIYTALLLRKVEMLQSDFLKEQK